MWVCLRLLVTPFQTQGGLNGSGHFQTSCISKSFRRKALYKDIGTYCSYIIRNSFYLIFFPQILSDGVFFYVSCPDSWPRVSFAVCFNERSDVQEKRRHHGKDKKSSRCTMSALYKINQTNSHINMHKGVRVPCVQKITKPFYGI